MRRYAWFVTLVLAAAACGGRSSAAGENSVPAPAARAATARRQANLVTADEIKSQGGNNLREVLQALRPSWFRTRPTRVTGSGVTSDPISLFVDGRRVGTVANLGEIPIGSVVTVRFYSASEAQGRFGMDNLSGAIEVATH